MSAPAYQDLATLPQFFALGLPAEACRSIPTDHGVVQHAGGTALLTPDGKLDVGAVRATSLPFVVNVVAGGALGVATWRWSLDGGVTWQPTAATPANGALVLASPAAGATGVTARVTGALSAGETWTWEAVSALRDILRSANDEGIRYLQRRYATPLTTVPWDVIRDVCVIAKADALAARGYSPEKDNDELVESRARDARKRFRDAQTQVDQPRIAGAKGGGPRVSSGVRR